MRVAVAQINSTLGDFSGNAAKIIDYIKKAEQRRCDLVVFPEAALFGYHPVDLLERESIVKDQIKHLDQIQKKLPATIGVVLGAITLNTKKTGKPYHNSAVFMQKNKKMKIFAKQLLPTYDVFDEARFIEPGDTSKSILKFKKKNILITVCEDIWAWPNSHHGPRSPYRKNPLKEIKPKDVDLVVNLSASPYTYNKAKGRDEVVKQTSKHFKSPIVYCNMVGAQDEIIFDGNSFVLDENQKIVCKLLEFEEDLNIIDLNEGSSGERDVIKNTQEKTRKALTLGIRDFVDKTGFQKVHLGLSGGVDSAVVACLAADAVGPMNVTAIALPSQFNSPKSLQAAEELAENLGIELIKSEIIDSYKTVHDQIYKDFGSFEFGLANENIQARLRGLFLMAYTNLNSSLLLNTSNKSEIATGYTTLYGDQVGGLCPIGDLLKSQVYKLAEHYNSEQELIPRFIIDRPPSAELRPNQKDQDSLPDYDQIDKSVTKLVEKFRPATTETDKLVLSRMMKSEFKRWQAPPILKVSNHAFGRGRRLPIAHKASK